MYHYVTDISTRLTPQVITIICHHKVLLKKKKKYKNLIIFKMASIINKKNYKIIFKLVSKINYQNFNY